jgi:hypothetical protein
MVASLDRKCPGQKREAQTRVERGIFDKETRRKPLVFAADAVYGDSKAVWHREARAGAPMNAAVPGSQSGFGMEIVLKRGCG